MHVRKMTSTTREREGRERGTGEFRLGQHGFLHPFELGAAKAAAYLLVAGGAPEIQSRKNLVISGS
jgi:hypothetical protein